MATTKSTKEAEKREEIRQEKLEENVSSAEKFFKENGRTLWTILAAAVVVVLAALAWNRFVYQPKTREAQEQAFPAETSFQNGEYELALNGDGNNLGFADIIDQYGAKAGKSMPLYAGICELQLGNYEEALAYLKKYKGKEPILKARALACMGDAYVGLEDYKNAIAAYKAAVGVNDNILNATYLLKEGLAYEALGDKAAALACYETIREQYPQSVEAYDITKYIARVSE